MDIQADLRTAHKTLRYLNMVDICMDKCNIKERLLKVSRILHLFYSMYWKMDLNYVLENGFKSMSALADPSAQYSHLQDILLSLVLLLVSIFLSLFL